MILLVVFIISFSLSATEVCGWQRKYPKYDRETSVRRKVKNLYMEFVTFC